LKQFNIPSVSPELANDNFYSNDFFIPYKFVTQEVLEDNYPWIHHTFKKLAGELVINPSTASFEMSPEGNDLKVDITIQNTGL